MANQKTAKSIWLHTSPRLQLRFNCEVQTITSTQVPDYLVALPFVERTKASHREDIGFFIAS